MPVLKAPWWNLTPIPLVFGERGGVFLQDPEDVPPLLAVEVVPQEVPGPWGPCAVGKGWWSMRRAHKKTDVKDLWNLFCLTDWQKVTVNFWLHPIHKLFVFLHQPCGKLYYKFQAGGLSYQMLLVCCPSSNAPSYHWLVWYTGPARSHLACHGLILRDIC